jgi:hypothetical protein
MELTAFAACNPKGPESIKPKSILNPNPEVFWDSRNPLVGTMETQLFALAKTKLSGPSARKNAGVRRGSGGRVSRPMACEMGTLLTVVVPISTFKSDYGKLRVGE